jgi:hypothetical protein
MNIEPEWPLPATIVIPGAVYGRCMEYFLDELFSEDRHQQIVEGQAEFAVLSDHEDEQVRRALGGAISVPFWRRREHAARDWDLALARLAARKVMGLAQFGGGLRQVRVDPRSAESWCGGLPRRAKGSDPQGESICLCLVETYEYCCWLAEGGHPDLGRWIARAVEQGLWS